ncbi:MAG: hypothetical protein GY739_06950 [Mesoflavibacter sp.]|nr:hypothetical protein [Mesoflavibacter sp.]
MRETVYKKFGGCCAYCGDDIHIKQMEVDHIIPKSNYDMFVMNNYKIPTFLKHLTIDDVEHIDNKFPSCIKCNRFKDNYDLESFRRELFKQLERARKYSTNYQRALKWKQVKETPTPIIFYFEQLKTL